MRNIYIFLVFLLSVLSLEVSAQAFDQVSNEAGYTHAVYYTIADGSTTAVTHESWDIAFATGALDVGIHVNEAVGRSFVGELPQTKLFVSSSTDFANVDTTGMIRLYNDELSWEAGAFNSVANPMNPADLGWGTYDFASNQLSGSRVFIIEPRSGGIKKLKIESLQAGVYNFRYAELDGSNEVEASVDKNAYPGATLAYFSFERETQVEIEPANWDLLFTRYTTLAEASPDIFVNYTVTGVLSNKGIEVAKAKNIEPATVDYTDYEDAYITDINAVGWDWKSFQDAWFIATDVVYFVKANNTIWKLRFVDFEGSSTGVTTLEKTKVGEYTSLKEMPKNVSVFEVYPNPASNFTNVVFEVTTSVKDAQVKVFNQLGELVQSQKVGLHQGLNAYKLPLHLSAGTYYLSLQIGGELITKSVIVQ